MGAFDGLFFNNYYDPRDSEGSINDHGYYLNYTHIKEIQSEDFNLAPRYHYSGVNIAYFGAVPTAETQANILWIDTAREAEISLGPEWPYEPLNAGECLIN